ncbi:MAG: CcdB family protein [Nannocystaceae bacterium]|nr:CcdB family protein [bacterium]
MAQFDIYRNSRKRRYPLLLDIQDDLLSPLPTRVVVPLTTLQRYGARPITRLNPTVVVDGTDYVAVFQELAAVPASVLRKPVGSLSEQRADFIGAIDLLFTGI